MVTIEITLGIKANCSSINKNQHFLKAFPISGTFLGALLVSYDPFNLRNPAMTKPKSAGVSNLPKIAELANWPSWTFTADTLAPELAAYWPRGPARYPARAVFSLEANPGMPCLPIVSSGGDWGKMTGVRILIESNLQHISVLHGSSSCSCLCFPSKNHKSLGKVSKKQALWLLRQPHCSARWQYLLHVK